MQPNPNECPTIFPEPIGGWPDPMRDTPEIEPEYVPDLLYDLPFYSIGLSQIKID